MRDIILRIVNSRGHVSNRDLALGVMGEVNPVTFNYLRFEEELAGLIFSGEIILVNFFTPDNSILTIYFPKGTTVGKPFDVTKEGRNTQRRNAETGGV